MFVAISLRMAVLVIFVLMPAPSLQVQQLSLLAPSRLLFNGYFLCWCFLSGCFLLERFLAAAFLPNFLFAILRLYLEVKCAIPSRSMAGIAIECGVLPRSVSQCLLLQQKGSNPSPTLFRNGTRLRPRNTNKTVISVQSVRAGQDDFHYRPCNQVSAGNALPTDLTRGFGSAVKGHKGFPVISHEMMADYSGSNTGWQQKSAKSVFLLSFLRSCATFRTHQHPKKFRCRYTIPLRKLQSEMEAVQKITRIR